MEHATPANIREFLDTLARDRWQEEKEERAAQTPPGQTMRIIIPSEAATSYEEVLRQFFTDALYAPRDQALIQLWTLALDLAYAGLEEQNAEKLGMLFSDPPLE